MYLANEMVKIQCEAQNELARLMNVVKKEPTLHLVDEALVKALQDFCAPTIEAVCTIPGKNDRIVAMNELLASMREAIRPQFAEMDEEDFNRDTNTAFDDYFRTVTRRLILEKHYRQDGRGIFDIRPLTAEVAVLPVVHGSSLFSRGETQAMVIATLGNEKDSLMSDNITNGEGFTNKRFYLHYNFPNYSVGEVGRISGPGRREIGHGDLAERSVSKVVPKDFPYVVRCVSEIMGSNGSTSMASVCGATLALMDAGVPITAPVAGISCGLVTSEDGSQSLILTDILGAEDHFGDMDFKVCGTRDGITGFQLDLKLPGISIDLLCQAMQQNREARMQILDVIEACIPAPRAEISPRAPQILEIKINPDKIGALIGPGGKNIRAITEETGASIDIEDDGSVKIMADDKAHLDAAYERVLAATAEAEAGKIYRGKVGQQG
jgi:polyribonucleotide nucleotidyltransferase